MTGRRWNANVRVNGPGNAPGSSCPGVVALLLFSVTILLDVLMC